MSENHDKTNEMSEPVEPDPARIRSLHNPGLTEEAADAATAALPRQASMSPSNTHITSEAFLASGGAKRTTHAPRTSNY